MRQIFKTINAKSCKISINWCTEHSHYQKHLWNNWNRFTFLLIILIFFFLFWSPCYFYCFFFFSFYCCCYSFLLFSPTTVFVSTASKSTGNCPRLRHLGYMVLSITFVQTKWQSVMGVNTMPGEFTFTGSFSWYQSNEGLTWEPRLVYVIFPITPGSNGSHKMGCRNVSLEEKAEKKGTTHLSS